MFYATEEFFNTFSKIFMCKNLHYVFSQNGSEQYIGNIPKTSQSHI